jgi:adenylate cyclase
MVADPGGQSLAVLPDHGRKLIAVVYADMAGYSRLIGLDDAGTFERLRALHRDLIDPALVRHGGTLVSTGGDSLLITFDSIVPAMRFAVDVQRGVPDFDGDYAPDRTIRFRMGVNVGDVIPDGANLHGEGVNVAARLQAVCPPGAICVSRIVRDHVDNRLGLDFKELGAIGLKGIARPTEAFLLELAPQAAPPDTTRPHTSRPGRAVAWVGATFFCMLAASISGGIELAGVRLRSPAPSPPVIETLTPPPRLSVGILPLSVPSGNPDLAQLADGVTEDLITDLTELSNVPISAQQSAPRFKDQPINVRKVGQELNVRYVLTGSLRRVGAVVRANVTLMSSETGVSLWVDQIDVEMSDGVTDQEEIAGWLRNSIRRQIINAEAARSARERPDHPDALDLIIQARAVQQGPPSAKRFAKMQALYEQALRLDPASASAMTGLATTILTRSVRLGASITEADLDRAQELTATSEAIAPTEVAVLWTRGWLLRVQQRYPEAEVAFEHVLSVYPHFDGAIEMLGVCKIQLGLSEEAIPLFQKLIRDDPHNPDIWSLYFRLGQASLITGRYDEAVHWIQRSLAAAPEQSALNQSIFHATAASAYALAGHIEQAREEVVEASSLWPYLTTHGFMAGNVANETFTAQIDRMREGVRLAGLRDYVDENEDFGTVPDRRLRTEFFGKTPLTVPGATTIRTSELAALLHDGKPVVIDATAGNRSLVGAINLYEAGLGGTIQDSVQDRLRPLMAILTGGDLSRPIVTLGENAERWTGYNLALRLVALGYRQVYWYRGGREAWEVAGLPMTRIQVVALAAQ